MDERPPRARDNRTHGATLCRAQGIDVRENVFSGCSHLNRVLFLGKTTEEVRNIPYSSSNPQKSYPWGLPTSLTPSSVIVGELST